MFCINLIETKFCRSAAIQVMHIVGVNYTFCSKSIHPQQCHSPPLPICGAVCVLNMVVLLEWAEKTLWSCTYLIMVACHLYMVFWAIFIFLLLLLIASTCNMLHYPLIVSNVFPVLFQCWYFSTSYSSPVTWFLSSDLMSSLISSDYISTEG